MAHNLLCLVLAVTSSFDNRWELQSAFSSRVPNSFSNNETRASPTSPCKSSGNKRRPNLVAALVALSSAYIDLALDWK